MIARFHRPPVDSGLSAFCGTAASNRPCPVWVWQPCCV